MKIGVILNKALPQAEAIKAAFELAQSQYNEQRKEKNCPIELIIKDDQDSQEGGLSAFQEIIADKKVFIVIAATRDEFIQSLASEAEKRQVVLFITNSTSLIYSQMNVRWIFRLPASSEQLLIQSLEWIKSVNAAYPPPTMVSISSARNQRTSLQGQFLIQTARYGWSVIGNFTYKEGQERAEIITPLRNLKPEMIFLFGLNKEELQQSIQFIAAARAAPRAIVLIPDPQENPYTLFDDQVDVEGFVVAVQWAPQVAWYDDNNMTAEDVFQALSKQLSTPVTADDKIIQAYTALKIAAAILEKEIPRSSVNIQTRIQAAFQNFNTRSSLWGPVSFGVDGQNKHEVLIIQRQSQQWEVIYPVQYRTKPARYPMPVLTFIR